MGRDRRGIFITSLHYFRKSCCKWIRHFLCTNIGTCTYIFILIKLRSWYFLTYFFHLKYLTISIHILILKITVSNRQSLFAFTDEKTEGYRFKDGKWKLREENGLPEVLVSGEVGSEMPD